MKHTSQGQRRLIQWIDRSGLTQRNVAKLLEISPPQLNRILTGNRAPSVATGAKIEHVTGIPMRLWADSWHGDSDRDTDLVGVSSRKSRG